MSATNYLHNYCVNARRVNIFKSKVDKYLRTAGYTYMKNGWTIDKPMASLSTCLLGLCLGWQSR